MIKRHGVIGGPKQTKPVKPKMKPGFVHGQKPKKAKKDTGEVKVFVISAEESQEFKEFTAEEIVEPEEAIEEVVEEQEEEEVVVVVEQVDPVREEDLGYDPSLECPFCDFTSKSKRGLSYHMRRVHPTGGF